MPFHKRYWFSNIIFFYSKAVSPGRLSPTSTANKIMEATKTQILKPFINPNRYDNRDTLKGLGSISSSNLYFVYLLIIYWYESNVCSNLDVYLSISRSVLAKRAVLRLGVLNPNILNDFSCFLCIFWYAYKCIWVIVSNLIFSA